MPQRPRRPRSRSWRFRRQSITIVFFVLVAALTVGQGLYGTSYPTLIDWLNGKKSVGEIISGQARVIDGDTIDIKGQRIRLHGIDAPESRQTCTDSDGKTYGCGKRAKDALSERIGGQAVSCERRDVDRYGRIVAVCTAGGEDLNSWMVSQGWALAYQQYSVAYLADEAVARVAGRGIWAGEFEQPWDWRGAR